MMSSGNKASMQREDAALPCAKSKTQTHLLYHHGENCCISTGLSDMQGTSTLPAYVHGHVKCQRKQCENQN